MGVALSHSSPNQTISHCLIACRRLYVFVYVVAWDRRQYGFEYPRLCTEYLSNDHHSVYTYEQDRFRNRVISSPNKFVLFEYLDSLRSHSCSKTASLQSSARPRFTKIDLISHTTKQFTHFKYGKFTPR